MILGDTHGTTNAATGAVFRAEAKGCDAIVQVGDFGYWEHMSQGVEFLDSLSRACVNTKIKFYWIDGNHENHTMLRDLYGPGGPKHEPTDEGFWKIREGIYYIPRATKWAWDGVEFMGVGGAYSIDKEYRLARENGTAAPEWGIPEPQEPLGSRMLWWPEEMITPEEEAAAIAQGEVDVLFTHDCPTNAPFRDRLKPDMQSEMHRQTINRIGRSAKPFVWFHGHMHEFYDYTFQHEDGYSQVYGLECDGHSRNWAILDTDSLFPSE